MNANSGRRQDPLAVLLLASLLGFGLGFSPAQAAVAPEAAAPSPGNLFAAVPPAWPAAVGSALPPGAGLGPVVASLQARGYSVGVDAQQAPVLLKASLPVSAEAAAAAVAQAHADAYQLVDKTARDLIARSSQNLPQSELVDIAAKLRLLRETGGLSHYLTDPELSERIKSASIDAESRLPAENSRDRVTARMAQITAALGSMSETEGPPDMGATPVGKQRHANGLARAFPHVGPGQDESASNLRVPAPQPMGAATSRGAAGLFLDLKERLNLFGRRAGSALAAHRPDGRLGRALTSIAARLKNPLVQVALSMGAAALFGVGLFATLGAHALQSFASVYMVEWSMSLDNLAVLAPIIFGAPLKNRPTVLRWSLIGSIVARLAMVMGGVTLVQALPWVFYVAGAFLLATALKTVSPRQDAIALTTQYVKKLFSRGRAAALTEATALGSLSWLRDPVVATVLLALGYDVLFSVDSVSVALGLSNDTFIICMANVFSILGLRALFSVYNKLESRFEHISKGTAAALIFVGARMILEPLLKIKLLGDMASTLVVFALLLTPIAYSLAADLIRPRGPSKLNSKTAPARKETTI